MTIEDAELKKISELPEATTFTGLFTIGTDSNNSSVKVPLSAVVNPPYINATNGHWMVWSMTSKSYVDSGKVAEGHDGLGIANSEVKYAVTENEEADVRTLEWGSSIPTVPVGSWLRTRVILYYSDSTSLTFYTKSQHTANGKSAYDLAVEGGYTGTEAEYIDLLFRVAQNDNIWLTEEEWDALETKDPNKTYNIYEEV